VTSTFCVLKSPIKIIAQLVKAETSVLTEHQCLSSLSSSG